MKPWKIVILCSLCMFVGSMYQGCAVGEADADDDTDTTSPPKAASGGGIVLEVRHPHTIDSISVVVSSDEFYYDRSSYFCSDVYHTIVEDGAYSQRYSTLELLNEKLKEAQLWVEEHCCPDGYAFKGISANNGALCVSE